MNGSCSAPSCFNNRSSAWPHALSISSVGLRMDDNTNHVTVFLQLCSAPTPANIVGLVSAGGGVRVTIIAINDILYRALSSAGLNRLDGKWPGILSMVHGNMASL